MARLLHFITLSASLPWLTTAFGMDIHNQIGFMAEHYLTPQARFMVQSILEPEYNGSIGRAAAWADTVARTTHRYSYTWHWTSARDDPPHICNLYYHRDCQTTGCAIQQIANQTSILSSCAFQLGHGDYTANTTCQEALKWILHFAGDTAQPLHNSDGFLGGNLFNVTFNGTQTNMHKVWDSAIAHATLGLPHGFSNKSIDPFFEGLVEKTMNDSLPVPRDEWILGGDPEQVLYWAERWGRDSNAINCDVVYGRYVEGMDLWLEGGYAGDAWEVLRVQYAKAAWRLGGLLNGVAGRVLGPLLEETGEGEAVSGVGGGNVAQIVIQELQ